MGIRSTVPIYVAARSGMWIKVTLQPAYEIAKTAALANAMNRSNLGTASNRDRIKIGGARLFIVESQSRFCPRVVAIPPPSPARGHSRIPACPHAVFAFRGLCPVEAR